MTHRSVVSYLAAGFVVGLGAPACQPPADAGSTVSATTRAQEAVMDRRATGTFDVDLTPQESRQAGGGSELGRMAIEKRFRGDIQGTGRGEMLTAVSPVEGSAAYVAIEEVRGTLHGLEGSFLLQHTGVMDQGGQQLDITVVPDSGTGALEGITGAMTITMGDGTHAYEFTYRLRNGP